MSVKADWIAVDWGTSSLRAWAMNTEGQDLETASSDQGMGQLLQTEAYPLPFHLKFHESRLPPVE